MRIAAEVVVVFLSILLNTGLISAIETHIYTSESRNCTLTGLNYRLPDHVVPRSYAIRLSIHSPSIDGKASIMIEIFNETSEISLNAHEIYITNETVTLKKYTPTIDEHEIKVPTKYRYCSEPQVLFLTFDKILHPGIYELKMEYSAIIQSSQGFVETIHEKIENEHIQFKEWSYITSLEQTGARRVFPCWDEPTFKAIFNITVVHWSGQQVFSNMPYRRNTEVEHWNIETEFEPTFMIATYLVTIAIITSNQTSTNEDRIWFRLALNEEENYMLQGATNKIEYMLGQYISNISNSSTIKIVAYPDLPSKVEGGWGLTIFRETDLFYKPKFHFIGRIFEIWKLIASELTRQCIETYVSSTEWSYVWLSKALASYLSYDIIEKSINMNVQMTELFVVQILQPAMHYDDTLNVPPVIHEYDPIYSILIDKKASALIRMMERIVTKKVLQQAIAEYIKTYVYHTATPNDFMRIVDSKINRSEKTYKYNITEVMYPWLSQRKYPKLIVTQDTEGFTKITTYNIQDSINEQDKWTIPITYRTENITRFNQEFPEWWLDNNTHSHSIIITNNDWILFNVQQFGYYRVNYDDRSWQRIANIFYKNHEKIHVLSRAMILDDAYHFLMDYEMEYVTFSVLIQYLRKETDFIVWHSMMNILQYMSNFFNMPESLSFKKLIFNVMTEVLHKIGYYQNPHDDRPEMIKVNALRLLLMKWSCQHGHKHCRKNANHKLVAYINDPQTNPILPGWWDWTYCAGLMEANETIWNSVQRNIVDGNYLEMLQHLACNDNDDMIIEHLKSIAMKPSHEWIRLKGVQLRKLYHTIVKKHARKKKVLDFLLENYHRIFPRDLSVKQILFDIIMSLHTICQLRKTYAFVQQNSTLDKNTLDEVIHFITIRSRQVTEYKKIWSRIPNYRDSGEC